MSGREKLAVGLVVGLLLALVIAAMLLTASVYDRYAMTLDSERGIIRARVDDGPEVMRLMDDLQHRTYCRSDD